MENLSFPSREEFDELTSEDLDKLIALTEEYRIPEETNAFENVHEGINPVNEIQFSNENVLSSSGFVECIICEISFCGTSATLEKHMIDVHKGQKKSEFMKNENMRHANEGKKREKLFHCKFCDKSYSHPSPLIRHNKKTHHKVIQEKIESSYEMKRDLIGKKHALKNMTSFFEILAAFALYV